MKIFGYTIEDDTHLLSGNEFAHHKPLRVGALLVFGMTAFGLWVTYGFHYLKMGPAIHPIAAMFNMWITLWMWLAWLIRATFQVREHREWLNTPGNWDSKAWVELPDMYHHWVAWLAGVFVAVCLTF